MTTLIPRGPYSKAELEELYPAGLQLQLVQILLRHGERTPVSARFRNAGLRPYWPYCNAARQITSVVMSKNDVSEWDNLEWRRRLETLGPDDGPIVASGPGGEVDAVCLPGELTDKGRQTTLALGQRLRHLYVDQLGFMPKLISDGDMIYLRATPVPRALESMQQTFWGLYPTSARTADFPPPTMLTRTPAEETLYPNDGNCRRLAQLTRAFAQRTADRWNEGEDLGYVTSKIGKWMPEQADGKGKRVLVDSKPRLSGVMDTINSTLAHGPETRLPKEFYDKKAREIIDRISVEEWFSGYMESREYRMLGIGSLMGDIVGRMMGSVEHKGNDGLIEVGGASGQLGRGRGGESKIKLAMSGCHDTTLAAILSSLGAFGGEQWPPYSSHVAIELFRKDETPSPTPSGNYQGTATSEPGGTSPTIPRAQSWWTKLFGGGKATAGAAGLLKTDSVVRKPLAELSAKEQQKLDGYYVRLRYNDRVMKVPECAKPGKHFEGDESFCTLATFKSVVDAFTPKNWKAACAANSDAPALPTQPEPAGLLVPKADVPTGRIDVD